MPYIHVYTAKRIRRHANENGATPNDVARFAL